MRIPLPSVCEVTGCDHKPHARWQKGKALCRHHYQYLYRLKSTAGTIKQISPFLLPPVCEVAGCDRKSHSRWQKGKAVCNRHWQYLYRYGQEFAPPKPTKPVALCQVQKCHLPVRSGGSTYCEKHYMRVRRRGSTEDRAPIYSYVSRAGYVVLLRRKHPLSMKNGYLFEHRQVVYDACHGICPACYWCGRALTWPKAVIDHLDENKQNNILSNLAPSCNPCNRARGAMLPFLRSLREEAMPTFIKGIMEYRRLLP